MEKLGEAINTQEDTMKTFNQFLNENNYTNHPEQNTWYYQAKKHLRDVSDIIDSQEGEQKAKVDHSDEVSKSLYKIQSTLEYGLKNEDKLKEAVAKAIELLNTAKSWNFTDFSSWNQMTQRGKFYGK